MVEDRRVLLNGVLVTRFTAPVAEQDAVTILDRVAAVARRFHDRSPPKAVAATASRPVQPHQVIYEDEDLLIVHKPAGLLTSTSPGEKRPTLLAKLRVDLAKRDPRATLGLIHRLDRDASGLLVFSKNDAAYQSLKSQFFHHDVTREYHAVVRGTPKPPKGRIESRLVERADGHVYSTKQIGRGDRAVTDYELVRTAGRLSLVRLQLHTGRKHQIRVHLSQQNWSILGDPMYGHGEKSPPETRLMLVATRLGFVHPRSGKRVEYTLDLPEEMARLVPAG